MHDDHACRFGRLSVPKQAPIDELGLATQVDIVGLGRDARRDDRLAVEAVWAGGVHDDCSACAHGRERTGVAHVGHHNACGLEAMLGRHRLELGLGTACDGPASARP